MLTMSASRALISLDRVSVRYRHRAGFWNTNEYCALQKVSFDIYPGDSLGVVGRNGVGKSTLLKVLAGIISPDTGCFRCADGLHTALLNLRLGFEPALSGRDNAMLAGMLFGLPRKAMTRKMDGIVAFAELEAVIDEPLHTYSTGMKARLGFSVALQCQPDVLLIDEVLGVGDAGFRTKATQALHSLIRSEKTVVLVSHTAGTIRKLCNRAVWIDGGVVKAVGTAEDVVAEYETSMPSGDRQGRQRRRSGIIDPPSG